jgi:hypothetical protein
MPDATWYFCRNILCGHRGRFVAEPEDIILCPKCDRPMVRRDVAWTKAPTGTWEIGKEEGA